MSYKLAIVGLYNFIKPLISRELLLPIEPASHAGPASPAQLNVGNHSNKYGPSILLAQAGWVAHVGSAGHAGLSGNDG